MKNFSILGVILFISLGLYALIDQIKMQFNKPDVTPVHTTVITAKVNEIPSASNGNMNQQNNRIQSNQINKSSGEDNISYKLDWVNSQSKENEIMRIAYEKSYNDYLNGVDGGEYNFHRMREVIIEKYPNKLKEIQGWGMLNYDELKGNPELYKSFIKLKRDYENLFTYVMEH